MAIVSKTITTTATIRKIMPTLITMLTTMLDLFETLHKRWRVNTFWEVGKFKEAKKAGESES